MTLAYRIVSELWKAGKNKLHFIKHQILLFRDAQECHLVSRENYFYQPLEKKLLEDIFARMKPMAEKWIGNKIKLAGTSIYGIRRYMGPFR